MPGVGGEQVLSQPPRADCIQQAEGSFGLKGRGYVQTL